MDSARRRMKELDEQYYNAETEETLDYEKQLQELLWKEWDKTRYAKEWKLVINGNSTHGQYHAGTFGTIDLLAKHKKKDAWLVIELKRQKSSDTAVGQILRYMGWVKENLADSCSHVEGLIISAAVDENLKMALKCISNVSVTIYSYRNGIFEFMSPEEATIKQFKKYVQSLSPEEKAEHLRRLKQSID